MYYTYQDLEKVLTDWQNSNTDTPLLQFVQGAIQSHKSDSKSLANYKTAVLADEYYRHRDRTIVEYQKLLYDISGHPKVDEWGANYKLSSNFLFMAVNQLNQYLLSNGVTWGKSTTAKRLGTNFDSQAQKAGAEALGIYAVLHEAHTLIQRKGRFVLCHDFQFQLDISCFFCAFDAGFCQCSSDTVPLRRIQALPSFDVTVLFNSILNPFSLFNTESLSF